MTASSNVKRFPVRNPQLIDGLLRREELLTADIDTIREFGPLCATGTLAEELGRVTAIVHALSGPGRVYLVDGLEVAIHLLEEIRRHASNEVMGIAPLGTARQVTK